MADAVFWQLLETVQTELRDNLTFSTQSGDTVAPLKDRNIVIRKLPFALDDTKNDRSEDRPGIIISPTKAVRPPDAGTNARDDCTYHMFLQFIDSDPDSRVGNLKTYLKWHEQICKYFQSSCRPSIQSEAGFVNFSYASSQDVIDPRPHGVHKWFVSGIQLQFISRENRGVTT